MNIKFRLIGSVIAIFLIVVGMFAATWVVTSSQKNDSLVINLAGRQRMLGQKLAKEAMAFEKSKSDGLKAQIASTIAVFEATQKALSDSGKAPLTLDPAGAKGELPEASSAVKAQLQKVRNAWQPYKEAINKLVAGGDADVDALIKGSGEVFATMNAAVVMLQHESEARVTTLLYSQLGCVILGVLIVLLVLYNLQSKLTKPLEDLRQFVVKVADGYYDATIEGRYIEELQIFKEAVVDMVKALNKNITEVEVKSAEAEKNASQAQRAMHEAERQQNQVRKLLEALSKAAAKAETVSHSVAESVVQLAAKVDEVNNGTDIQRDRMAETATAMEEMNATVLEVARNASSAAESAGHARANAQTGADGVRAAVVSIDSIKVQILDLNASMSELGKQAENIGNIMNVVTDIADQTNLLALNAAIEAARAGEAGRGFAVVADEVRKLAEKTMTATKEVGDVVGKIQIHARDNIRAVEKSVEDIVKSTEAAEESGQFMSEIVTIVEDTARQVESIAAASEEQSAASEEINRAIADVTRIASETAAGMGEARQALENMARMASELDKTIQTMTEADTSDSGERMTEAGYPMSDRSGLKADNPEGLVQWDDDLSVNVRAIDEQHLKLINLINSLQSAMLTGKAKGSILGIVDELKNYTVFHFGHEEKLFDKYKFAERHNHEDAHRAFVEKVVAFEKDLKSGKATVSMEIMEFLKDWLIKHIKGVDKRYSAHFNAKGVF